MTKRPSHKTLSDERRGGTADDGAADAGRRSHVPVMLAEVLDVMAPRAGDLIVDGTYGAGGYSTALLDAAACRVLALDRDPAVVLAAGATVSRYQGRLRLLNAPFSQLDALAGEPAAGVVLDIGVSSMQIDQPERGFSFQHDGPLDMRMSQSGPHAGASAAEVVNSLDADALADVLYRFGEERRSRQIAKAIVMDRVATPFTRTKQLADLICRVLKTPKIDGRHAATRTFQALRIYVNDELGELERGLAAAERILQPGGRLAVVTFHSLEDKIVKTFLRTRAGRTPQGSRHEPVAAMAEPAPTFELAEARASAPAAHECAINPRARSARLRWAIRTDAAAWGAATRPSRPA